MYTFKIRNTDKTAREQYYQKQRVYVVDVPAEQVPHSIRVWLVDHPPENVSLTIDDATPEIIIEALRERMNAVRDWVLNASFDDLIRDNGTMCVGRVMYADVRCISSDERWINWEDGEIAHIREEVDAEISRRNAVKSEEQRIKAEKRSAEVEAQKEAERLVVEARKMEVRKSLPVDDYERFDAGLMPEEEQRCYLRDRLLPLVQLPLFRKFKPEDVCSCEEYGEYGYSTEQAEELTRSQFENLKMLREKHPNATVEAQSRIAYCVKCNESVEAKVGLVEMKVGDWKINRRYVL